MQKCLCHFIEYPEEYSPIQGTVFRQFLDICWPFMDYITFATSENIIDLIATRSYESNNPDRCDLASRDNYCALKKALHPWFAGSIIADEWFGYGSGGTKRYTYRYRATDGAKEAILSCYQDIFLRLPNSPKIDKNEIGFFDDLCLFTNGRLFFGSISHEGECYLWTDDRELFKNILTIGRWITADEVSEQARIDINKYPWK